MKILTLTCNRCGESLEVAEAAKFITCTACSSQLEVHRSGSTACTDALEAVEPVKAEIELEKLDREWTEKKRLVRSLKLCQLVAFLAMIAGLVVVGCVGAAQMKHLGGPGPGPPLYACIFWGIFLVVGWIAYFLSTRGSRSRIAEYHRMTQDYETRRRNLLQEIETSRKREDDQYGK